MLQKTLRPGFSTYLRLLRYVGRYWIAFVGAIMGLVIHSAAEITFVDLLGYITDTVSAMTSASGAQESPSVLFGLQPL